MTPAQLARGILTCCAVIDGAVALAFYLLR